jgi:phage gp36-like protein
MGMYATANDVRLAVARNPAAGHSAAELSDDQINQALSDAQSQVDGYLRRRYTLPFPEPVPALAVSLTIDIAAYLAGLNWYQETEMLADDPLALRYQRAVALLKDIQCGEIDLDVGDGAGPAPDTAGAMGPAINQYGGSMFDLSDFGLGYGCGDRGWGRW